MEKDYTISVYLDKRRAKQNGKFPLKLTVFTSKPRGRKMYTTKFEFEEKEFEKTIDPTSRGKRKEIREEIDALVTVANNTAKKIQPFTFEAFEKRLFRSNGDTTKLNHHYKEVIQDFKNRKKISTASSYGLSEKSLEVFFSSQKKKYKNITFYDITKDVLNQYEDFMTDNGKSLATVSIYLRALRAIFNIAIAQGDIPANIYPFNRNNNDKKYKIPVVGGVKKALSKEQLGILFNAEPKNTEQEKAKDFWFFSYACNGINVKDIANLKYKDFDGDKFRFIRAKTKSTAKKIKAITVHLNDFTKAIIEKYGNPDKEPNSYVFDILNEKDSPSVKHKKLNNFNRFISQNIKKLCEANGLPTDVSAYWARHSFATNAIRNGASMEFIQESLGHENIQTTQNYIAGFDDETKKEFANSLMNF